MNEKYIRIAELSEQIEKLNAIITFHQNPPANYSTIRQYTFKRDELIGALEAALQSLHLTVHLAAA